MPTFRSARRGLRPASLSLVCALFTFIPGCAVFESASAIETTPVSDAVPPLERLGRWNGTTFVPVAAGSIEPGLVTVLVHGWGHGLAPAVRTDPGKPIPLVWDAALRASHRDFYQDLIDLAAVLDEREPETVVLAYSWIDDSATGGDPLDARISRLRAPRNGARLALALTQAFAPGFRFDDLHFIAHSHGSLVATTAALALPQKLGQLTLLDAPEDAIAGDERAACDLAPLLRQLEPSRSKPPFVENYISEFGEPYHEQDGLAEVVDVSLSPPEHFTDLSRRHKYAVVWYTESAKRPAARVGHWWNRWTDALLPELHRHYAQVPKPDAISLDLAVTKAR